MSIEFYNKIEEEVRSKGFTVVDKDLKRPWGAFYVIDENQAQEFANVFFDGINVDDLRIEGKLSPKILIVKPGARLSWQYHNRRAEIWQVFKGEVGVIQSKTDFEGKLEIYITGEKIKLEQGIRHRIVGLNDFGVVAEIWQHTSKVPSDEEDIIRVQDDFGR